MSMTPQEALVRTIEHREIFHDEMLDLMRQIMSGKTSPVMIAAITIALRVKKETIGEITAAAQVMRELATKVEVKDAHNLVDVVGTGGDGARTVNISTAALFVAAAPGRVRRELGVRTIFNILGPLTNPAGAPTQLMGVFHPDLVGIQIRVLQRLGARHAMTVFGLEGLDEISISGKTMIGELKEGRIEEDTGHPERFGLPLPAPRARC